MAQQQQQTYRWALLWLQTQIIIFSRTCDLVNMWPLICNCSVPRRLITYEKLPGRKFYKLWKLPTKPSLKHTREKQVMHKSTVYLLLEITLSQPIVATAPAAFWVFLLYVEVPLTAPNPSRIVLWWIYIDPTFADCWQRHDCALLGPILAFHSFSHWWLELCSCKNNKSRLLSTAMSPFTELQLTSKPMLDCKSIEWYADEPFHAKTKTRRSSAEPCLSCSVWRAHPALRMCSNLCRRFERSIYLQIILPPHSSTA